MRTWIGIVLMLLGPAYHAFGATAVLRGVEAYGDWTQDTPGLKRIIRPEDMPSPKPWESAISLPHVVPRPKGAMPKAPPGFNVTAYATGLNSPRQMRQAPSGDVFVAESGAKRIRVLKALGNGGSVGNESFVFADGLEDRPYGIAFYPPGVDPQFVYIATEGKVVRYPYRNGDLTARGPAQVIVPNLPKGHHWTRDILFTPDGKTMLVSVGSGSNNGEKGMDRERNRGAILAFDPDGSRMRLFASGLRNPVSMAFDFTTKALWTTVNERDGLGDNLPPDYVTRVKEGGFYGWPWYYIGLHQDPTFRGQKPKVNNVLVPDVLFQAHSSALGLAQYDAGQFSPEYKGDFFVAFHGSWNRSRPTGFKVVRVPVRDGQPTGEYEDFVTGFITRGGDVWGRPVGVAVARDGALLVSDDASGTIWRIAYAGK